MAAELGRPLVAALSRHAQSLLLTAAGSLLFLFCGAPILRLIAELPFAGSAALDVLATPRAWILLARSLLLATAVTTVSLCIGVPLGALVARSDLLGRRLLWILHAFPMFLPPFLMALGWFDLLGREGALGNATTTGLLFSEVGLIAVLALTFSPIVTSLVALALAGIDASLEEAARTMARPWRVATRILLPAVRPAIALAAIIVFSLAVSELGVPLFLRVDVYPAAVFARLGGMAYEPGEAVALALPLLVVAVVLLLVERRLVGKHTLSLAGLRGMARMPLPLGRWKPAMNVGCWGLAILGLLPLCALATRAVRRNAFGQLGNWLGAAPWTSVGTAFIAASIIAALSLVIGHAFARRLRGATLLDALALLTFVTPAAVLGIGVVALWNHPATSALYGSGTILVIGYVARYGVVGIRTAASVLGQSPVHLEDAAATTGANAWRRLTRIVLPINARGMAAAWLLAMVFCLRDLDSAVLFYPAGREPLPVRIFTLDANGPGGVVAALAITHVLLTAVVLTGGWLLLLRRRLR